MRPPTRSALAVSGGLLVGVVVRVVGRLAGFAVPWSTALAAGLALGVIAAAALHLPATDPVPPPPQGPPERQGSASFGDLGSLRFTVEQDSRDADRFETRLRPRLCALAVERLRQRHGLDWDREPDRATGLLGPELVRLLTAPPHALRPTPQALSRWVSDLEAL